MEKPRKTSSAPSTKTGSSAGAAAAAAGTEVAAGLGTGKIAIGCLAAFCTGMIAVPFLISAAKARKFRFFGFYCLAAATIAIALGFLTPPNGG